MLPGDRLVCAFVKPQVVGSQFKTWLLHVTVIPWFRLAVMSETIVTGLQRALTDVAPFEVAVEGSAMLGPKKNRAARLLVQPSPFTQVETKVRNYLHKKRALLVDETTRQRQEFRPHVTDQGEVRLQCGDRFWCDRLYVVEQKGRYKQVVGEVVLHG